MYGKPLITRIFWHLDIFGNIFCCWLMNIFLTQFWTEKLLIHKPQPRCNLSVTKTQVCLTKKTHKPRSTPVTNFLGFGNRPKEWSSNKSYKYKTTNMPKYGVLYEWSRVHVCTDSVQQRIWPLDPVTSSLYVPRSEYTHQSHSSETKEQNHGAHLSTIGLRFLWTQCIEVICSTDHFGIWEHLSNPIWGIKEVPKGPNMVLSGKLS